MRTTSGDASCRLRWLQGQRHDEAGTRGIRSVEYNIASQTAGQRARYGKADACAVVVFVELYEFFEDMLGFSSRNADAGILNGETQDLVR